jgi:glycosyltransferase involved in cell wall biosynthesis
MSNKIGIKMTDKASLSITVVIPTYDRASFLPETLNLILSQTRQPDEIIVVDDGSTDNTLSVLNEYDDKVRVITIPNSGDLVARNTGLHAASGDLVAFCDSDDLWQPEHLKSMAAFWAEDEGPLCAYSDFREVRDGHWSSVSKFETAPKDFWDRLVPVGDRGLFRTPIVLELLRFQPFFVSCMVVDRLRFLEIGGWDDGVSRIVGCDFATTLRIAEHPPIGVLRRPTVGIRKHPGNISGDVLRMNLGDANVLTHVLATRSSLSQYETDIRASILKRRRAAFDTAFASKDFVEVGRIAKLLNDPAPLSRRVKHGVARLPEPVRTKLWRGLTWIGSRRSP